MLCTAGHTPDNQGLWHVYINIVSHNRRVNSINHPKFPKQHVSVIPMAVFLLETNADSAYLNVDVNEYMDSWTFLLCLHVFMWVQDRDFVVVSVQALCSISVGSFRRSTSRNIPNSLLSSWTASGCPAHGWKGSGGFVSPGEPERWDNVAAINVLLAVHSLLWIAVLGIIKDLPLVSSPLEASRLFWCLRGNKTSELLGYLILVRADCRISKISVQGRWSKGWRRLVFACVSMHMCLTVSVDLPRHQSGVPETSTILKRDALHVIQSADSSVL